VEISTLSLKYPSRRVKTSKWCKEAGVLAAKANVPKSRIFSALLAGNQNSRQALLDVNLYFTGPKY
jgi:hypothetical protein